MAIDSAYKRRSIAGIPSGIFGGVAPDGEITQLDRAVIAGSYFSGATLAPASLNERARSSCVPFAWFNTVIPNGSITALDRAMSSGSYYSSEPEASIIMIMLSMDHFNGGFAS